MKTWNDCPICGAELMLDPENETRICCSSLPFGGPYSDDRVDILSNHYWVNIWNELRNDVISLNKNNICRNIDGTKIWDNYQWVVVCDRPMPLSKLSIEKIEKLLLLL